MQQHLKNNVRLCAHIDTTETHNNKLKRSPSSQDTLLITAVTEESAESLFLYMAS